jgi:acyl-coenzyme A thioesterase PaaI-like protein
MSTQSRQRRPRQKRRQSDLSSSVLNSDMRELLRSGLEQAVPFNLHNDIHIVEVSPKRGTAELPDLEHLRNHLGTQHGGALFAAAEAAAGAAYVGAFGEHLAEIRMNAQEAHITYIRWAKGKIMAKSYLEQKPQEVLNALRTHGRVDLPMSCTLYDANDRVVAEMTFRFHLKQIAHS